MSQKLTDAQRTINGKSNRYGRSKRSHGESGKLLESTNQAKVKNEELTLDLTITRKAIDAGQKAALECSKAVFNVHAFSDNIVAHLTTSVKAVFVRLRFRPMQCLLSQLVEAPLLQMVPLNRYPERNVKDRLNNHHKWREVVNLSTDRPVIHPSLYISTNTSPNLAANPFLSQPFGMWPNSSPNPFLSLSLS